MESWQAPLLSVNIGIKLALAWSRVRLLRRGNPHTAKTGGNVGGLQEAPADVDTARLTAELLASEQLQDSQLYKPKRSKAPQA